MVHMGKDTQKGSQNLPAASLQRYDKLPFINKPSLLLQFVPVLWFISLEVRSVVQPLIMGEVELKLSHRTRSYCIIYDIHVVSWHKEYRPVQGPKPAKHAHQCNFAGSRDWYCWTSRVSLALPSHMASSCTGHASSREAGRGSTTTELTVMWRRSQDCLPLTLDGSL